MLPKSCPETLVRHKLRRHLTRRRLVMTVAAAVGSLGLYAWRVEPRWLQVVRRKMAIRNLPQELVGAALVQASDLHIGPQVDDAYLFHVFGLIRELSPEIVVYTGDFISFYSDLREHVPRVMTQLACGSLGTFGILGNHDYGAGWRDSHTANHVASLAENSGVRILRNDLANVCGLQIVGLDELWADRCDLENVMPRLRASDATVALVHNPDAVDRVGWDTYSGWILAGHTHGGQCKPPFSSTAATSSQSSVYER